MSSEHQRSPPTIERITTADRLWKQLGSCLSFEQAHGHLDCQSWKVSFYMLSKRTTPKRAVLLVLSMAFVSLILIIFTVHSSFSPSPTDEENYHPVHGRFLHIDGHLLDGGANFNKLRSQSRDEKSGRPQQHDGKTFPRGNNISVPSQPCNCSARRQRQSGYPFSSFKDQATDSFSIVILTYNRTDLLLRLLNHYSAMPHLERIIVVWNCKEMPVPEEEWTKLGPHPVPVEFKVQTENRLRNRLQLFPKVKSSALFLIDDDLLISTRDIQFAFRVWKQFPHLIVGFYPRKHVRSPLTGLYSYGSDELDSLTEMGSLSYSMVLTGAAFVHREYIRMFNDRDVVPQEIHDLIDSRNNCEDIAMNVMVGRYLLDEMGRPQCSGLFVKPVKLWNLEKETSSEYKGLWWDPSHLAERSFCLNRLATIYNGNPLPLFYSDLVMVPMQSAMIKC